MKLDELLELAAEVCTPAGIIRTDRNLRPLPAEVAKLRLRHITRTDRKRAGDRRAVTLFHRSLRSADARTPMGFAFIAEAFQPVLAMPGTWVYRRHETEQETWERKVRQAGRNLLGPRQGWAQLPRYRWVWP